MLWNNRGGTGKTMFTYHLANKYAVKPPDKTVLVIVIINKKLKLIIVNNY